MTTLLHIDMYEYVLVLQVNDGTLYAILKPGAYYNVVGCISLRPYKQLSVATKNSSVIALVSTSFYSVNFITLYA